MIGIESKYKKTFDHFGLINQLAKLDEEVEEFKAEVMKFAESQEITFHDVEWEGSDVMNVILGIIVGAGGSVERTISKGDSKMTRTVKRIDSGYYEEK